MVLIVSFVSEAVSRVFGSGDRGDQDSTTMVGSLPDRRIPSAVSRSVACAFGLLLLGLAMLVAGLVLWQVEGMSALIGLWVCGLLVLIPGVYFTRVAYLAYKGVEGYSWADIPDWPSAS